MTVVITPRLELNRTNVVAIAGVVVIVCGVAMVCQHPAVREALKRIVEDPHVRDAIYREAIAPVLQRADAPNLPPIAG